MADDPVDDTTNETTNDATDRFGEPTPKDARVTLWRRRVLVGGAVIVALIIGYFMAASFVPRWWAQRVGSLVDGGFTRGVLWGLFFGSLFTLIPLLVAWQARRPRFGWKAKAGIILFALVLAIPNLMTLGVVLGNGNGAHAGERIFDVEAPAFRGATLAGSLSGAVCAIAVIVLFALLGRRGRQIETLRTEKREADTDE